MKHPIVCMALLVLPLGHPSLYGQPKKAVPEILSVYPLGGVPDSVLQVNILGKHLRDAEGVRFDCKELQGEIQSPSTTESGAGEEQVTVKVRIGREAKVGIHILRLFSPFGVSGRVAFNVNSEPTMEETSESHDTPETAQSVTVPSAINGKLARSGELDLYKLDVQQGQELHVEVLNGSALFEDAGGPFRRPELVLYKPNPSWFGTGRHKRLEGVDESTCFPFPRGSVSFYCRSKWVYRFTDSGSYVLQVGTNGAQGGPHFGYQLRVLRSQPGSVKRQWWDYALVHESPFLWQEWDFKVPLEPDRLKKLQSRSATKEMPKTEVARVVREQIPNDTHGNALAVQLPTILEGQIEAPGDRDYFRFSAKAGERIVFELENPDKSPHYFNARIAILNSTGEEMLANIYRRVGGDGDDWLKSIQRKTLFDVQNDGDYYVELRDMTDQRGGERYVYRVLVRPAIPHVGSVKARALGVHGTEPEVDRVNLSAGEVRRLDVISDLEEGFDGEVAISVENLPEGVQAFSGAAVVEQLSSEPGRVDEARGAVDKDRYLPTRVSTTILLVANPDAPLTLIPQSIRLVARPIVKGVVGEPIPAQELAFMVTAPNKVSAQGEKLSAAAGAKQPKD